MRIRAHHLAIGIAAMLVAGTAPAATSLSVTGDAAITPVGGGTSNFGLKVSFDGTTSNAFVQKSLPEPDAADQTCATNGELDVWATFMSRRNNGSDLMTMSNGSCHVVMRGRRAGIAGSFNVWACRDFAGNYVTYASAFNDAGAIQFPAVSEFNQTTHKWTAEWHAASAPGANDGIFRLYKGTSLRGEITTIDNDAQCIHLIELGAFGGVDTTTGGELHLDNVEITRAAQF